MLSLRCPLQMIAAAVLVIEISAFGQPPNTEFKITNIKPTFQESPIYSGPRFDKRTRTKPWLEIEATFEWQPQSREPTYTEELTFNYYILLKGKAGQNAGGALLVGSVTHASIPQQRDMHSAVYVSPRTLERFFDGKIPPNAEQAVIDVGVTITREGQQVASASWKSRSGDWWPQFPQISGFVLNKNETPFAPLAWDYFEQIKARSPGQ